MSAVEDETQDGPESPGNNSEDQFEELNYGKVPYGAEKAAIARSNEDQERAQSGQLAANGTTFKGYGKRAQGLNDEGAESPPRSRDGRERPSSADGSSSIPEDTPSIQASPLSTPDRGVGAGSFSRSPTPSLRPFDRRFKARLSSLPREMSGAVSPAFLNAHSRTPSTAHSLTFGRDTEIEAPWEVVKWTKLRKMTNQAFSEVGKRNFGQPTCIAISISIVLGTSKGIILIFDYSQNLKIIIGPGTKAIESGAVTSISISADHSTVAGGHASGSIFTWEVAKPAKPFLHIAPTDRSHTPATDGHSPNAAILHIGFLGIRHTALSSADDKGMAFSHLATRGMGVVARTVKTTRILGRYPDKSTTASAQKKPSSVLSFSPLPLGNVEHIADTIGLVAMLTPYLLVIVSTMPIAQTQFKAPRAKEVAAHSAMTGALAWFPSVRLKSTDPQSSEASSKAKLVYCWSNVLTVLDVIEIEPSDAGSKSEAPSLQFKPRSRWKSAEAIVGVQWLSRSVLAVLTITQQLVIIEDVSMTFTDSSDLIQKHIYHKDLFSQQLDQLVDQLEDEEIASMHGVVADAFYMSFRAYKGRLFLLGYNEVSFGTLSNWADRLMALVERGSYIQAIELATGYYIGDADKVTVGLPEDDESRHKLVQEKITGLIIASLNYAFRRNNSTWSQREARKHVDDLAQSCILACIRIHDMDFLFGDVYPWYQENRIEGLFLEHLESDIDEGAITVLPPQIIKDLVNHYTTKGLNSRLEEILCLLDPHTMDIDQITGLCKRNHLYDALLYVWNQALGDYTTILDELLDLGSSRQNGNTIPYMPLAVKAADASKVYPYLSYTLTGRIYPVGKGMSYDQANLAKAEVYNYFFSGRSGDRQPRGDESPQSSRSGSRLNFPNLRKILNFDAPSFLSMLNEAFEDSFLNGPQDRLSNETPGSLTDAQKFGLSVNRQWIVSILLEIMTPPNYEPEETIYLDMFIARNLPKFPQFILLPGHVLHKILIGLCQYPSIDVADDCQLSVEYLLSIYQPPDMRSLLPILHKARFYRVLKSVYKNEKQYSKLLQIYFEDQENLDEVYDCIADCLAPATGLNEQHSEDVRAVIVEHAQDLIYTDVTKTAATIDQYAPDLHDTMLMTISEDGSRQYHYLQMVLEPPTHRNESRQKATSLRSFTEMYLRLMCIYNPSHVRRYVDHLETGDLRLDEVLPALESSGVVDAAIVLMVREGKVRNGIDRLTQHLHTLKDTLLGLLDGAVDSLDVTSTVQTSRDVVISMQKYARVGVWLCQRQTRTTAQDRPTIPRNKNVKAIYDTLSWDEELWLDLIDAVVTVMKAITDVLERLKRTRSADDDESDASSLAYIVTDLRTIVQETFTALLNATTASRKNENRRADVSFLRILRAFLSRVSVSSPSLSSLRGVLSAIFSAYSYEEELLSLSNKLLDKDLFVHVTEADTLRRRGWRPLGQVCEGCGKRLWGPGAGGQIWEAWQQATEERRLTSRSKSTQERSQHGSNEGSSKGKGVTRHNGKMAIPDAVTANGIDSEQSDRAGGAVVIFSCRHMFHRSCLEKMHDGRDGGGDDNRMADNLRTDLTCPLCS